MLLYGRVIGFGVADPVAWFDVIDTLGGSVRHEQACVRREAVAGTWIGVFRQLFPYLGDLGLFGGRFLRQPGGFGCLGGDPNTGQIGEVSPESGDVRQGGKVADPEDFAEVGSTTGENVGEF